MNKTNLFLQNKMIAEQNEEEKEQVLASSQIAPHKCK